MSIGGLWLIPWDGTSNGVRRSGEPANTCRPCVFPDKNHSRLENEKTHPGHPDTLPRHSSCDSVDISRKFYYTNPKPDQSSFYETGYWVPNIVHFIWYSDTRMPFRFHHMLSVMSAHRYIKPDVILFHTNMEPTGQYWDKVLALPSFQVVKRNYTLCINDHHLRNHTTKQGPSDVDRMRVLSENGGIYLDLDVMVVRSLDTLRRFPCTVGAELPTMHGKQYVVCGAVIICSRHSQFLHHWRQSFIDDYRPEKWAYNSGSIPTRLWQKYPHLVHVEKKSFFRPGYRELDRI